MALYGILNLVIIYDLFNGEIASLDWANLPSRLDVHNVMIPGSPHTFFSESISLDELYRKLYDKSVASTFNEARFRPPNVT